MPDPPRLLPSSSGPDRQVKSQSHARAQPESASQHPASSPPPPGHQAQHPQNAAELAGAGTALPLRSSQYAILNTAPSASGVAAWQVLPRPRSRKTSSAGLMPPNHQRLPGPATAPPPRAPHATDGVSTMDARPDRSARLRTSGGPSTFAFHTSITPATVPAVRSAGPFVAPGPRAAMALANNTEALRPASFPRPPPPPQPGWELWEATQAALAPRARGEHPPPRPLAASDRLGRNPFMSHPRCTSQGRYIRIDGSSGRASLFYSSTRSAPAAAGRRPRTPVGWQLGAAAAPSFIPSVPQDRSASHSFISPARAAHGHDAHSLSLQLMASHADHTHAGGELDRGVHLAPGPSAPFAGSRRAARTRRDSAMPARARCETATGLRDGAGRAYPNTAAQNRANDSAPKTMVVGGFGHRSPMNDSGYLDPYLASSLGPEHEPERLVASPMSTPATTRTSRSSPFLGPCPSDTQQNHDT